jgi:hypothetical protein
MERSPDIGTLQKIGAASGAKLNLGGSARILGCVMPRNPDDLWDEPLVVTAHRGAVVLHGPRNIALALTADAAEQSAELRTEAARIARRGRRRRRED